MYILVEKDLATQKEKKKIHNLENLWLSKYPFAIFKWMYLIFVDYPTKKKTLESWFALLRCQWRKHMKRTKIKNPRVYIYRAISVMLTSLFRLFSEAAVSFCGIIFPTKHSLRCWSSVSRHCPPGGEAVQWLVAEVGGGLTKWHQRVGWVVGAVTCCVLLSVPTWVCIVRACRMLAMASAGIPNTHALRAAYRQEQNTPQQPTWEELGF